MGNIVKVDRIMMKERYMNILKENHELSAAKMGLDHFELKQPKTHRSW